MRKIRDSEKNVLDVVKITKNGFNSLKKPPQDRKSRDKSVWRIDAKPSYLRLSAECRTRVDQPSVRRDKIKKKNYVNLELSTP